MSQTNHPGPDISVILEWENALWADPQLSKSMLEGLHSQLQSLERPAELILQFNHSQIDPAEMQRMVEDAFGQESAQAVRLEAANDLRYYDLKNAGARLARGEVIVFVDCDTAPTSGWLVAMTEPFFDNPEIQALAGHTHCLHQSLYEKAFALGWFFSLPEVKGQLTSDGTFFFANNAAFRRQTFEQHAFPAMPEGQTRGACLMLAKTLREEGIAIWKNTSAQVAHPPPNGVSHFLARGLAQGRDFVLLRRPPQGFGSVLASLGRQLGLHIRRMSHNVARHRDRVDLSGWQSPFAWLIMLGYHLVVLAGGGIALVAPGFANHRWRI